MNILLAAFHIQTQRTEKEINKALKQTVDRRHIHNRQNKNNINNNSNIQTHLPNTHKKADRTTHSMFVINTNVFGENFRLTLCLSCACPLSFTPDDSMFRSKRNYLEHTQMCCIMPLFGMRRVRERDKYIFWDFSLACFSKPSNKKDRKKWIKGVERSIRLCATWYHHFHYWMLV